jgi:hypothetical protein
MKKQNFLLIGGGLLLLYLFLKKKQPVQPIQETKSLIEPGTSEQPVLVTPLQQVTEQPVYNTPFQQEMEFTNNGTDRFNDSSQTYRVRYIAGKTHYI